MELLTDGLDRDQCQLLQVTSDGAPRLTSAPAASIVLECLFDLLTDLVLLDHILVEAAHVDTWQRADHVVAPATRQGTLRGYDFQPRDPELGAVRDAFAERLAFTAPLRELHAQYTTVYREHGVNSHPLESQILWSGAGMLARAVKFDVPYTPHPARRRFYQIAGVALPDASAADRTLDMVRTSRTKLQRRETRNESLMSLRLLLDPIPLQVIREVDSPAALIAGAVALRDRFRPVCDWLGLYQQHVNNPSGTPISTYERTLIGIARGVDDALASAGLDQSSMSVGFDGFSLSWNPAAIWRKYRNRLGVRAMINQLVLAPNGRA
ncbi:hypothetical protein [Xanthomonas euroxanthea]|uniref:hypothetical protein n=1 Tax=Xanthomonas euroxanthea TaxID=2259622 RepID=UPI0011C04477|nr:hypothetical protein [Xanthomonas euroxanthea]CAE1136387.1 hypothetical protein XTG_002216 [Xanthomonas euroxanthea]